MKVEVEVVSRTLSLTVERIGFLTQAAAPDAASSGPVVDRNPARRFRSPR
ncbi:MAG: hypothetical protein M3072_16415 [Candidatus Dormibacteraeota bacterium]|nr:hypothetical protein [Candidatus Dormibacteraeota bacterium]